MSYSPYGVGAGGYAANYGYDDQVQDTDVHDQRSANPTQAEARNNQGGGEPAHAHEEGAKGGPCAQRQHQHQKGTNDANKLRDGYQRSRSVSTAEPPRGAVPARRVDSANSGYGFRAGIERWFSDLYRPYSFGGFVPPPIQGLHADSRGNRPACRLAADAYAPALRSASAGEVEDVEGDFGSLVRRAGTASFSPFKDMDKTLLAGGMGLVLGLGMLGGLTSSIGNLFGGALAASGVFGNPWMNCYSPYCCPPPFVSPFLFPLP
ncbi:hypothetical protein [Roseateles sp. MS654]|uniref:hypothetical protein n=1 Tax=Roseateles sp. MS654 TaxID=3412685 RepID=UPI003C2FEE33